MGKICSLEKMMEAGRSWEFGGKTAENLPIWLEVVNDPGGQGGVD